MKKFYKWVQNESGWHCPRSGYSIVPWGENSDGEDVYDILNPLGFSVTGEANTIHGLKATANMDHIMNSK